MYYFRISAWGRVFTLKGEYMPELLRRSKQLQPDPPEPVTSIVTRSGERVELKGLISKQENT